MGAKWSFLCFQSREWSRWSLAKRIRWLDRLQSQEKRAKLLCLFRPVLFSWMVDKCIIYINNDVNSLCVEIIDKNRTRMHDLWPKVFEERKTRNPLELCSRQRWETTQANHNFECDYKLCFTLIFIKEGYHIRKYKRYLDNPNVLVPISTSLDRNKHSATRSNTTSHLDSSVRLSTELAVVPIESSVSHNGETFAQETEATICD